MDYLIICMSLTLSNALKGVRGDVLDPMDGRESAMLGLAASPSPILKRRLSACLAEPKREASTRTISHLSKKLLRSMVMSGRVARKTILPSS